jgi:DNA polymerase-1
VKIIQFKTGVKAKVKATPKPSLPGVKVTLVNTPLKADTLLRKLVKNEGSIGFDTEVVGPNLRGQDFVNITHASLLGFSVAFEDKKCYYIPVRHKGNNASFAAVASILKALQPHAAQGRVWAHNAKFDHQVLIREGIELDGLLDSMVGAWLVLGRTTGIGLKQLAVDVLGRTSPQYDPALHSKTGDEAKQYAGHDALNTLELGLHYKPLLEKSPGWDWFVQECSFAHTLAHIKLQGIAIDIERLMDLRTKAQGELAVIQAEWSELDPDLKITSSKDLQRLFEEGTWASIGNTPGGQFDTGKKAMQYNVTHGRGDGPRFAELRLKYQEVAKIVTTYTEGLVEEALQWADHKLHADLFHFGTVTGRLASANPNLQNQPAHGEWAKLVRECFISDPGMEFTAADYSQIELRYFAEYCGGTLLEGYQKDVDLHQMTADVMGITRQQGKMVNFGFLLYGGGPDKLAKEVECTTKEAEQKIAALHARYPEVEAWRQQVIEAVGGVVSVVRGTPTIEGGRGNVPWATTLVGRRRTFPELNPDFMRHYDPKEYDRLAKQYAFKCRERGKVPTPMGQWMSIRSRGERLVVNYLIQGGTRDLLVLGMNHYRRRAPAGFKIVMTVHDEVLTQHPKGCGELARKLLKESLEHVGPALGLEVPIVAEPTTGADWSEV